MLAQIFRNLFSPEKGRKEYIEMQSCDYRGIIGCLNYLALTTRPGIAHTANFFQFVFGNLGNIHWNAAKACLRYLKATKSEKPIYRKYDKLELKGFSDSDWAGNVDNRKSTSSYCFKLDNSSRAGSWASKLKRCVSTSAAEAELIAVVKANKEVVHLANL